MLSLAFRLPRPPSLGRISGSFVSSLQQSFASVNPPNPVPHSYFSANLLVCCFLPTQDISCRKRFSGKSIRCRGEQVLSTRRHLEAELLRCTFVTGLEPNHDELNICLYTSTLRVATVTRARSSASGFASSFRIRLPPDPSLLLSVHRE